MGFAENRARPGGLTGGAGVQEGRVLTASVDSAVTHKKMVHVEPGFMLQRFEWCGKQIEVVNVYAPTAGGARIDFFSRGTQEAPHSEHNSGGRLQLRE